MDEINDMWNEMWININKYIDIFVENLLLDIKINYYLF